MARTPPQIFDRHRIAKKRQLTSSGEARCWADHNFLHRRAMEDIVERLELIKREFSNAAFFGAGATTEMLTEDCAVTAITYLDTAPGRIPENVVKLICDEERLCLGNEQIDLYVSLLTLHTTNDLVGSLIQVRQSLQPDGLFIAALFGEDTLSNLRHALYTAEAEITGGVAGRIAPFASVPDLGRALSRAGFALPVTDIDRVRVQYSEPAKLLHDLRAMGETAPLHKNPPLLRSDVWARACEVFMENGGEECFDIVFLTGWAPHESQQKPLKPGDATTSLAEAIKRVDEGIRE